MGNLVLIIAIVALVSINALIATNHFLIKKTSVRSPALMALKDITKVYEIMDKLISKTKASKAAISKVCLKCDPPYAQMLYDNKVEGEERYNQKYNHLNIDSDIITELNVVSKGGIVAVVVNTLRDNLKKRLYVAEGITYSQTHKIIETDDALYVMVVHYKIPVDEINSDDFDMIIKYNLELRGIFEVRKHNL